MWTPPKRREAKTLIIAKNLQMWVAIVGGTLGIAIALVTLFNAIADRRLPLETRQLIKTAKQGQPQAMGLLGEKYRTGSMGLSVNLDEAVDWFERGSKAGDCLSDTQLGWFYGEGIGLGESEEMSVIHLRRAVDRCRNVSAVHGLGVHYENGTGGLQQDLRKAVELYREATERGWRFAMLDYARILAEGIGVPRDLDLAITYNCAAFRRGEGAAEPAEQQLLALGVGLGECNGR